MYVNGSVVKDFLEQMLCGSKNRPSNNCINKLQQVNYANSTQTVPHCKGHYHNKSLCFGGADSWKQVVGQASVMSEEPHRIFMVIIQTAWLSIRTVRLIWTVWFIIIRV